MKYRDNQIKHDMSKETITRERALITTDKKNMKIIKQKIKVFLNPIQLS